jgi:hypothetical protein
LENTIKQTHEEKMRAIESVRRLHSEYKPLREEISSLRESIGLTRADDSDDGQIIESFLR